MIGGDDIPRAWAELDVPERASRLAITTDEYARLALDDPRIVDDRTGGIGRLRAWLRADRPVRDVSALCYIGDESIRAALVDVLCHIPMPVACAVIGGATVIGVGVDTIGWHQASLPDRPVVSMATVALSSDDPRPIAHELAHVWLTEPPSPTGPKTTREIEAWSDAIHTDLADAAVKNDRVEWLVDWLMEPELAADAAATCWLGVTVDTCSRRRERVLRAIRERAARGGGHVSAMSAKLRAGRGTP